MLKQILTMGTVAAALMPGVTLADSCAGAFEAAGQQNNPLAETVNMRKPAERKVIRNLRDAARSLEQQGRDEACQRVAETIKMVVADYRADRHDDDTDGADATGGYDASGLEGDQRMQEIRDRIVVFIDVDSTVDTAELDGADVYNFDNEYLGYIEGAIVPQGDPMSHLIVSHGSFWDLYDRDVAVPVAEFFWDPREEVFYLPVTNAEMDCAPDYDRAEDGTWERSRNDGWYEEMGFGAG